MNLAGIWILAAITATHARSRMCEQHHWEFATDTLTLLSLRFRSPSQLAAENLFLRKQPTSREGRESDRKLRHGFGGGHYFGGTSRFSPSSQFCTTTRTWALCGPLALSLIMRKRWPSGDTSYGRQSFGVA